MINKRTEKAISKILEIEKRKDGTAWKAERKVNSIEVSIYDAEAGEEVTALITLSALKGKRLAKRKKVKK